jgi:hypothetical protein
LLPCIVGSRIYNLLHPRESVLVTQKNNISPMKHTKLETNRE